MTTKLYLDTRTKLHPVPDDAEFPVKIAINHKGSSAYIGTSIRIPRGCWDARRGAVTDHPYKTRYNLILAEKKLRVDKAIEELREAGGLHGVGASGIKEAVERYWNEREGDDAGHDAGVAETIREYARKKDKARTVGSLLATARKVDAFAPGITFCGVTPAWLEDFDEWMRETSPSANARAVHLRNIRIAFNAAINAGTTQAPYPFKRFKIRSQPTEDRALSIEELRRLFNAPCTPAQEKYRDIFKLSFLLCGINLADLLALRVPKNGVLHFKRIKTGQPISMSLQPEAARVAAKYAGSNGLLVNFGEKYSNYTNLLHRINDHLKMIGKTYNARTREWEGEALFPELSYYWVRHTWATIAAELDVPERTVAAAYGHSTAKTVTSIYIRVDMRKKVDEANRRVIDAVFGGLE